LAIIAIFENPDPVSTQSQTSVYVDHRIGSDPQRTHTQDLFPQALAAMRDRQGWEWTGEVPEPQPRLFGSIRQGIPVRSTKIMPTRQARSLSRGRPPCGFGKGIGRSGSIKPHNVSGTSAADMSRVPPRATECPKGYRTARGFCGFVTAS